MGKLSRCKLEPARLLIGAVIEHELMTKHAKAAPALGIGKVFTSGVTSNARSRRPTPMPTPFSGVCGAFGKSLYLTTF